MIEDNGAGAGRALVEGEDGIHKGKRTAGKEVNVRSIFTATLTIDYRTLVLRRMRDEAFVNTDV